MDLLTRGHTDVESAESLEADPHLAASALWSAIEADRRALDERTARLRTMRLTLGDDEAVEPV